MSDLKALREVEGIRVKRVADAEDAQRAAAQAVVRAEQMLAEARLALQDYQERLPGLIEQLFADCIGHLVSREFVQDKIHEESRLRAKVEDYKAKVTEAQNALQQARDRLEQATARLAQERLKLDALRELLKLERRKVQIGLARAEARALDDLAGAKYVRAMVH